MKRFIKVLCVVLCLIVALPSAIACGGGKKGDTLVIRAYQGGYGSEVYDELVRAWNAKTDAGENSFYIEIIGDPMVSSGFMSTLNSVAYGVTSSLPDMFFVDTVDFYTVSRLKYNEGDYAGEHYLVDVTDVWTDEKYAQDGKTIIEKVEPDMVRYLRRNLTTGELDSNGVYSQLPYYNGVSGFVYFKSYLETFANELKNLGCTQFDENGKFIEPKTMKEFWDLQKYIGRLSINQISQDNKVYAILNDLSSSVGYMDYMTQVFLMQTMGEEEFYKYYNFDGVTDVNTMRANYDRADNAYEIMYNNVYKTGGDPASKTITNFKNYDNPTFTWNAMLIQKKGFFTFNGDWSQNEANTYMKEGDEIGIMPIPLVCDTESGLVIAKATPKDEAGLADDSNNDDYFKIKIDQVDPSVIPLGEEDDEYVFFKKHTVIPRTLVSAVIPVASKKVDQAKEFMAWLYSNEAGNIYTRCTGSTLPFNYEIEDDVYSSLSNFSKKAINMAQHCSSIDTYTNLYTSTQLRNIFVVDAGLQQRWIYSIFSHSSASHASMMNERKLNNESNAADIQSAIDLYELTIKNNNW